MPDTWADALGDLEARLAGAAGLVQASAGQAPATAWRPPTGAGPIPAELVDRARALLAAQQRVADELSAALADTSKHLTALRSIPSGRAAGAAVYLDVTG